MPRLALRQINTQPWTSLVNLLQHLVQLLE
jgi:hypothetical protein